MTLEDNAKGKLNTTLPNYSFSLDGLNRSAGIRWEDIHLPPCYLDGIVLTLQKLIFENSLEGQTANHDTVQKKVIIPFSGGKDSATVVCLMHRYFPNVNIQSIFLQSGSTGEKIDLAYAQEFATKTGFPIQFHNIMPHVEEYIRCSPRTDPWLQADAPPLVRRNYIEQLAREQNAVVIDPFNRSEWILGFWCKDCSWSPDITTHNYANEILIDIYATEVKSLGKSLGVPAFILERPQLTSETYTDKDMVAGPLHIVDRILWRYVDQGWILEEISQDLGHSLDYLQRLDDKRIKGQWTRNKVDMKELRSETRLSPATIHQLQISRERYF